eukprot:scaffold482_cov266-Amphora_coffeaeformis.AAC.42
MVAFPNEKAPQLVLPTVSGETFDLSQQDPEKFTIVVFYRGKHCPICQGYLAEIEQAYAKAKESGYNIVAVSMDPEEKAIATVQQVASGLEKENLSFPVAYGLTAGQARAWGLYLSVAIPGSTEPAVFAESGLFVIRPDTTIFMAQVQSAPFTRPNMGQLISGLNYAYEHQYPVRGTLLETPVKSQK